MVRHRARISGMQDIRDIVSVGWQWASYRGSCEGKGGCCEGGRDGDGASSSWVHMVRGGGGA